MKSKVANETHQCCACPEKIPVGDTYYYEFVEGYNTWRFYHKECYEELPEPPPELEGWPAIIVCGLGLLSIAAFVIFFFWCMMGKLN